MKATSKPIPNHKLASVSYGVTVACECGWRSSTWYGKGARSSAFAEFNGHRHDPRTIEQKLNAMRFEAKECA
ncbi:MAG: hypothetical protein FJX48_14275 [Alphaproteobacteria bacterium]|nr:hypothetical protein [Alphaproteobacteria bacterium]